MKKILIGITAIALGLSLVGCSSYEESKCISYSEKAEQSFLSAEDLLNMEKNQSMILNDKRLTKGAIPCLYVHRVPGGWIVESIVCSNDFSSAFIPYSEVANDPLYK